MSKALEKFLVTFVFTTALCMPAYLVQADLIARQHLTEEIEHRVATVLGVSTSILIWFASALVVEDIYSED